MNAAHFLRITVCNSPCSAHIACFVCLVRRIVVFYHVLSSQLLYQLRGCTHSIWDDRGVVFRVGAPVWDARLWDVGHGVRGCLIESYLELLRGSGSVFSWPVGMRMDVHMCACGYSI